MGTIKKSIEKVRATPILLGGVGGAAVGAGIAYFTGVKKTQKYLIYAGIGLAIGAVACHFLCKKKDTTAADDSARIAEENTQEKKDEVKEEFIGRASLRKNRYMTKENCEKATYPGYYECESLPSSKPAA